MVDIDFSDQTLDKLEGEYFTCNFNNATIKGRINAVIHDSQFDNVTFDKVNILRLQTPGTPINNLTIIKPSFQPVHEILLKLSRLEKWQFHSHEWNAGKLRQALPWITNRQLRKKVADAADLIESRQDLSWRDFSVLVDKAVWDLYPIYYFENPEMEKPVEDVIVSRWGTLEV